MFKCDKCGLCCQNIWMNDMFRDLDRGDGTCKYLQKNLCSIYENRPLFCRVEECYKQFYSKSMSKEDFYKLNYKICQSLKNKNYVSSKIK